MELNLRPYQEEVVQAALSGENSIIWLPTGGGKTRAAVYVAEKHLETKDNAKVAVLVNKVHLVDQHYVKEFGRYLRHKYRVKAISGDSSEKDFFGRLVRDSDLIICTAQILENALNHTDEDKHVEITDFTLLVIDECHHTNKESVYNKIMWRYVEKKVRKEGGLPQVLGLTASPGTGGNKSLEKAVEHVLQICANLDSKIVSTKNFKPVLQNFVPRPKKQYDIVEKRAQDPFGDHLKAMMSMIHDFMPSGVSRDLREMGTQEYEADVVELEKLGVKSKNRLIAQCALHLRQYNDALLINDTIRMVDAFRVLDEFYNSRRSKLLDGTDIFLHGLFNGIYVALQPKLQIWWWTLEAKTQTWKEFREIMEENYWSASKKFWQTVWHHGQGLQLFHNIFDVVELLISTSDAVGRWKENFEDLLNPTDTPSIKEAEAEVSGADLPITQAEVDLKLHRVKLLGVGEIHPEYLMFQDVVVLSWLTTLSHIAWRLGEVPLDWATVVVVLLLKKGDWSVFFTLLSLPKKVYAKVLARRICLIVQSWIQKEQCYFHPSRETLYQLYSLTRVHEDWCELAQQVHIDLEKELDQVPREILCRVVCEYGIRGALLGAVRYLYNQIKSLVRFAGSKSNLFPVHVRLWQGNPLSQVLLIILINRISIFNPDPEKVWFSNVILLASSNLDLLHALEQFAVECDVVRMKISTFKSKAMILDWKRLACLFLFFAQVEKYLRVLFTSESRKKRVDRRIGAATAAMQLMYWFVTEKKELSRKAKSFFYWSNYIPTITYGHEYYIMTERTRSQMQASLYIERDQLRWLQHLFWMSPCWQPVPVLSYLNEAMGKTEDMLEGVYILVCLGVPLDSLLKNSLELIHLASDARYENPKLAQLQCTLLKEFEDTQSRGIIFSKTRRGTHCLNDWVKSNPELQRVNIIAGILTGAGAGANYMTQTEQKDTISRFRQGYLNLLISTSVAEEGLDIPECNLVVRYGLLTNEIAQQQASGRARAANSVYSVVAEAGGREVRRELTNEYLEDLTARAIEKVQRMSPAEFRHEVSELQKTAIVIRKEAEKKKDAKKQRYSPGQVQLQCRSCFTFVCSGEDIRTIENSHHVNINMNFKSLYNVGGQVNLGKTFEDWEPGQVISCKKCGLEWGMEIKFKKVAILPCLKIKQFSLNTPKEIKTHKQWKDVEFQVTEFDFIEYMSNRFPDLDLDD